MKLLVRDLSRSTTEDQIKAAFEVYGEIESTVLVMDKKTGSSKGFGFVEMPNEEEAQKAIKHLNRSDMDGASIRVKKAND